MLATAELIGESAQSDRLTAVVPGYLARTPLYRRARAAAAGSLRPRWLRGNPGPLEASPSPVYGAALLMRFGFIPIPGSNPGASAAPGPGRTYN